MVGGPASTTATGYLPRAIQGVFHSRSSTGGAAWHDTAYSGYVDTVPYGCWRRETLLAIGGFDEYFVRNQDDELALRLTRAGHTVWQDASIRSTYEPRRTLRALARQQFQYGYWKVAVVRKHRLPASPRHVMPALFLIGTLIAAIASAWWTPALWVMGGTWGLYTVLVLSFSVATAASRGWSLLPVLPLCFATYHFSYGIGFLAGLIDSVRGRFAHAESTTSLTR
jgi:hypothetical protein